MYRRSGRGNTLVRRSLSVSTPASAGRRPARRISSLRARTVLIGGVAYRVEAGGRRLVRADPGPAAASAAPASSRTPRRVLISGVAYVKDASGRSLQRSTTEALRTFANRTLKASLIAARSKGQKRDEYCLFFTKFGKCKRESCRYLHDPDKVAVCRAFLRGSCTAEKCPLSHRVDPSKMQACLAHLQGRCERPDCPFLHSSVGLDAAPCEAFQKGYCPAGAACGRLHLPVCPAFARGSCPKGDACKAFHPGRKAPAPGRKRPAQGEARRAPPAKRRYFDGPPPTPAATEPPTPSSSEPPTPRGPEGGTCAGGFIIDRRGSAVPLDMAGGAPPEPCPEQPPWRAAQVLGMEGESDGEGAP